MNKEGLLTIGVDSPLELYTMVLGWHQYENLWAILTSSGLVFLPFLGLLLKNVTEPLQSQKANSAALTSLKRLELDAITALVVIVVAGQPSITLNSDQLVFHKVCTSTDGGETYKKESTNLSTDPSLYKSASFLSPARQAKIPPWWYGVLAFSSGFSYAARVSLPCMPDIRFYQYEITQATITNPELNKEVSEFYDQCFTPVRTFIIFSEFPFRSFPQAETFKQAVREEQSHGIQTWAGWRPYFIQSPNLYHGRISRKRINRIDTPSTGTRKDLHATCAEWWTGGQNIYDPTTNQLLIGLGERIIAQARICFRANGDFCAKDSIPIKNGQSLSATEIRARQIELVTREILVNAIVPTSIPTDKGTKLYETHKSLTPSQSKDKFRESTSELLSTLGGIWNAISIYPTVKAVREAAPAVQAFMLMAVYIILPFGLVFSSYSLKFLAISGIGIFTLKFWGYIFYLSYWIDQKLKETVTISDALQTPHWNDNFNFVMVTVYFLFPAIFIAIIGWAGFNVANSLQTAWDKLGGLGSSAGLSGSIGGSSIRSAGLRAFGSIGRSFGKRR